MSSLPDVCVNISPCYVQLRPTYMCWKYPLYSEYAFSLIFRWSRPVKKLFNKLNKHCRGWVCLSVFKLRRQNQFVYRSRCFFKNNLSVCLSTGRAYSSMSDVGACVRAFIDKSSQSINWQIAINTEPQWLAKSCGYIDPCVGHSSINLIRIINTDVVALMLLLLLLLRMMMMIMNITLHSSRRFCIRPNVLGSIVIILANISKYPYVMHLYY